MKRIRYTVHVCGFGELAFCIYRAHDDENDRPVVTLHEAVYYGEPFQEQFAGRIPK